MPFLTALLLLIVLARLLAQLAARYKQPTIVGEMLAGVILGPAILNLIAPSHALGAISELAVFLIVLTAGLEMNFAEVIGSLRGRGLIISVLSFVIPLAGGLLVGVVFDLDPMRTIFLGLSMAITALPVAVRILSGFKLLQSDIAKYSIASAILNDLAALLALGVILGFPAGGSIGSILWSILITGGKLLVLAGLILGFNAMVNEAVRRGIRLTRIPETLVNLLGTEALFGILVAFVLTFSSISDALGFHHVVGAFFGALLIDKKFFLAARYRELEKTISSVSDGFLAPVFFAYLGLEFSPASMTSPLLVIAVILMAIATKIAAGKIGGKMIGMSGVESLGIGIILNGRGVMGLVIASIAFEKNFIGQGLFSTLVLMSLVTTILAPILFRKFVLTRLNRPT
jgi:Kef-type K+ transport system membrane component KefB